MFKYKIEQNSDEEFKSKYEILNQVAQGSYGKVYKAKDKKTDELRAIKFIDKERIKYNLRNENNSNDIEEKFKEFQINFLNEIKLMKVCENENSIKYYEYYNTNENFIIIMELCDTNLQSVLNERPSAFNEGEIREILNQLNNTFKIMNDKKIIHRDLKLDNILIKYENNKKIVKLADYGISKQLISLSKCFTHAGTILTMAPEVLKCDKGYTYKCDLWSLGVIIYQLYFKDYPYKGGNEYAIITNIEKNGQKILKRSNDSKLDNLIRNLLIEDSDKRYTWSQYFNDEFFSN